MIEERHLIAAFGAAAQNHSYEAVIGAAANMLLNALRQSHGKHIDAEAQMEELFDRMRVSLRDRHYHDDGRRNDRSIVLPPAGAMFPELSGREAERFDQFLGRR